MRKFKWILISLCSLAILSVSIFIIAKNRQSEGKNGDLGEQVYPEAQAADEMSGAMEKSYRINNLPYNYTTEDINGNKIDIKNLIGGGKKMVLRYSELNCSVCVDSAFSYFDKFGQRIGKENVVLLVEYQSGDYLSQLVRLNHIKLPNIYRIINKEGANKADNPEDGPFLFVLDGDMQMKDVFYPMKEIPPLSEMYYNTMFDKYFKR